MRHNAHPHGAVNACARIPAAVGLVGIERFYLYPVFLAVFKEFIGVHIKIGIAVGATARKLTVDVYFGVAVNALEFEDDMLIFPLRRNGKLLFVNIIVTFIPAGIFAAGA